MDAGDEEEEGKDEFLEELLKPSQDEDFSHPFSFGTFDPLGSRMILGNTGYVSSSVGQGMSE